LHIRDLVAFAAHSARLLLLLKDVFSGTVVVAKVAISRDYRACGRFLSAPRTRRKTDIFALDAAKRKQPAHVHDRSQCFGSALKAVVLSVRFH
jgi:hypothetical protein